MAAVTGPMPPAAATQRAPRSPGAIILRRILASWQGRFGTIVLAIIVALGLLAPWLSPYSPVDIDPDAFSMPPSAAHWFGTDEIGRDVLSRVLHGATVSLQVVIFAIGLALIAGSLLGLVSGWLGGRWDALIMRIMDAFLAFPLLVLALSIVAVLGPDLVNAMLAIAITKMPGSPGLCGPRCCPCARPTMSWRPRPPARDPFASCSGISGRTSPATSSSMARSRLRRR